MNYSLDTLESEVGGAAVNNEEETGSIQPVKVVEEGPPYIQSKTGNIIIDVGGQIHNTRLSNLKKYLPASRLGKLVRAKGLEEVLRLCDAYIGEMENHTPIVFFDRNGQGFNTILDIYRFRNLHFTEKSCAIILKSDFDFWGIDEMLLEPCCALKYYPEMELCLKEQEGEKKSKAFIIQREEEENFGDSKLGKVRKKLWNLTEYPESGRDAQFMAFFSLIVVLISTGTFILGTLEEFKELDPGETVREGQTYYPSVVFAISIFDSLCVGFFTIEYIVRLLCSPVKIRFIFEVMNLVDLFAILPFYLSLFLRSLEDIQIIGKAGKIIRLVRVMRILRVFKLVRHFAGLQSLIHTMHQAYKELGLLLLLIGVAVLTVACLVYFTEREGSGWTFVDSFWFSLMTLTTVGYDLNPSTLLGKVTGGFCALIGIFILTLPIPIVVNSFASYYKNRLWRNEVAARKRERIRENNGRGVRRLLQGINEIEASTMIYGLEMKTIS
ncbi:potassium voltage-gated channel subfamily B member 1-like [Lepeophtheirus salmonis]|uniref:potassium voltage-gated channel subfamily B member 1-like n=1 Tax=Lepeophtheirus salmonis TaxID=72036 RepID=UPI001AE41086|nr:potassium voltage-gated channel subfamily B member 1-like [Lepeophtheirus salmonis]